jgi:hypothetical protein
LREPGAAQEEAAVEPREAHVAGVRR